MFQPSEHPLTELSAIQAFEKQIAHKLPNDYVDYLLNHNGAKPLKCIFDISENDQSSIHHMYGLNTGSEIYELEITFLDGFSVQKTGFLPIANDSFGNVIAVNVKKARFASKLLYGAIVFIDHEDVGKLRVKYQKLANGFNAFISSLKTQEESREQLKQNNPEMYEKYQKQLALMQQLRADEEDLQL